MGNKTYINGQKLKGDNFHQYFTLKSDIHDVRFGDGRVFTNKQEKDVDVLVIYIPRGRLDLNKHKRSSKNGDDQIHMQDLSTVNYMVQVYGSQKVESEQMCGTQVEIRVILEYVHQTLRQFIYSIKRHQDQINIQEILHIINRVARSINQLHSLYSYHGNINQDTISRTKDNLFVLYDNMLLTGMNTETRRINGNYKTIVPPELFPIVQQMYNRNRVQQHVLEQIDREKVDIYQLGIVALQLLVEKDLSKLIQTDDRQQLQQYLQQLISEVKHRPYNARVAELIKMMVHIDPKQRQKSKYVVEQSTMLVDVYMQDCQQEIKECKQLAQYQSSLSCINYSQYSQDTGQQQYQGLFGQKLNQQPSNQLFRQSTYEPFTNNKHHFSFKQGYNRYSLDNLNNNSQFQNHNQLNNSHFKPKQQMQTNNVYNPNMLNQQTMNGDGQGFNINNQMNQQGMNSPTQGFRVMNSRSGQVMNGQMVNNEGGFIIGGGRNIGLY